MQRSGLIPPVKATVLFDDTLAKAVSTLTSNATNVTNNKVLVIGSVTYTFKTNLTAAVAASAVLTSDNTNPTELDTVTIGSEVYTFMDALTDPGSTPRSQTPNEVLIGVDADTTLANLKKAVEGGGTPGVEYSLGTVPQTLMTVGNVTAHALTFTAVTAGTGGNAIAKAEASSHLDWDGVGAVFTGGISTVANEIKIGASAAATLDNIKSAINGTAGAGTTYSLGTVAHPLVTATTNNDTTQVIEAKTGGVAGNAIATTTDEVTLSWTSTVMASGGGTVGIYTIAEGGLAHHFITIAPALTGTPTYTMTIKDSEGDTLYVTGNLNEGAKSQTDLEIMLSEGDTIVFTASATVEDTLGIDLAIR